MIVKESMTSDNLLIENFNDYGEENQSEEERENQVPLEVSQEGKV